MKTAKHLQPTKIMNCTCEWEICPHCGQILIECSYVNGKKTVQTRQDIIALSYRPKYCPTPNCYYNLRPIRSAEWLHVAPLNGTYGYDIIAFIGWQRQKCFQNFNEIHTAFSNKVQISESQIRYLYYQGYHPLLACGERRKTDELRKLSEQSGLFLSLDGLAPEGGEPQLWVVRELQTGLTLRSGWMSEQSQTAFENFLQPIVDLNFKVTNIMSDKQRGLVPAIKNIFFEARHSFCQAHYLKNIAEPISCADESMKINLRKAVRNEIGELIKPESNDAPGVMTVTGIIPSSIEEDKKLFDRESEKSESDKEVKEQIVQTLLRRVRYLLTLKGRPPFRLAGIEMYEYLLDISELIEKLIIHIPDDRLINIQKGLNTALSSVFLIYNDLREAANWLDKISEILDPDYQPGRSGEQVRQDLFKYLEELIKNNVENAILVNFSGAIFKTTKNYADGLFHTYDVSGLPRTNNERESEFRLINQRLIRTTGQKGATRRIIQRSGAWEAIPNYDSLDELIEVIKHVKTESYLNERERVRKHRGRFSLHTRSQKYSRRKLKQIEEIWLGLDQECG